MHHDLDLDFSRSNMEFAISQPKLVRLPRNESKHIGWTLGLKCDHRVWPWPWPWPWIFKVKYRICHISAKNGQIASKREANITIELQASNVTNGFELDHNPDLWILKVKCDLDLWPHRWPRPWIFMVKFWNSCISEWEGWLTLHKGGGSRSFMTMIMTIWWPRSGVWIYQVVTGVTSVVGVPSTHLVYIWNKSFCWKRKIIRKTLGCALTTQRENPVSGRVCQRNKGVQYMETWPCFNIKMVFQGIGIFILKIRWSWDSLIFIMGIHILLRWHLYIEMGAWAKILHHFEGILQCILLKINVIF